MENKNKYRITFLDETVAEAKADFTVIPITGTIQLYNCVIEDDRCIGLANAGTFFSVNKVEIIN